MHILCGIPDRREKFVLLDCVKGLVHAGAGRVYQVTC